MGLQERCREFLRHGGNDEPSRSVLAADVGAPPLGERWRLAQTAPQRLVAALAAEADFLAYVVAADVPSARGEVADILLSSGISRSRASSAITQATLTLLEIAQLERVRLAPRERDPLGGAS